MNLDAFALLGTEDSIDILSIVRKIDKSTIPLKTVFTQPSIGTILNSVNIDSITFDGNGYTDGNIIILSNEKPRYEDHYLRISAPIANLNSEKDSDFSDKFIFSGEKIIIAPGGGVYYDVHDDIIIVGSIHPPMVFTKAGKDLTVSFKFVAAFLKSSIAIWYAERCLGSHDLRKISVNINLPIPNNVDISFQENIVKMVDEIISLENNFLTSEKQLFTEFNTKELRESDEFEKLSTQLINTHNKNAGKISGEIDELFYNFFNLSCEEITIIEQVLISSNFVNLSKLHLEN